tara:strand:- start:511 stop:1203 length:693 start_codon:yes stop_codon:yes gene_type:complete
MVMTSTSISQETLSILKNFSQLNSNLLVRPGSVINTVTGAKNVMAQATVQEDFPVEFGIWDLNKFLGTLSLFDSPTCEFGEKSVKISGEGGRAVTYYYSEPSLLTTINKQVQMPETVIHLNLTQSVFADLQRAASVLQLPDLSFTSMQGDSIFAVVRDKKDPTSNDYSVAVGDVLGDTPNFEFNFKIDNLKLLPGDYDVEICESVVSSFTNTNTDVKYWIALETDSTYNA